MMTDPTAALSRLPRRTAPAYSYSPEREAQVIGEVERTILAALDALHQRKEDALSASADTADPPRAIDLPEPEAPLDPDCSDTVLDSDPAATLPARLSGPGWTPDHQRAFVSHLAANGCVSHAARAVGRSKQSAYQLRDRSPNSLFALAWDVAVQRSRRLLLDEATERAIAGREVAVHRRGEQVDTRIVHNDRLLMFLLAMKRAPVHPNLTEHELAELWPTMLAQIDSVLPGTLTPERIAVLAGDDD